MPAVRTEHPHIVKDPQVCGGAAVIAGTRVPVWVLVSYVQQYSLSAEELAGMFPHLALAQLHDALSYWHDHREEITAEIAAQAAAVPPQPPH
ncbi:MAG: DUF433 domain-containing protein [Bacillati bacterium ANGP1]|uniref:DUF433 domain-containing protein n=1 Tax=Candidatus Segetimicrobium genomatis TaxID=2569760 RepID=A0A537JKB9_9BACT|nr:MAG: DUF433 domain-containing protein [Terrabacteria group bacterium ANGP1]